LTGLGSAARERLRNTIESAAFFVLPFACLLFILSEPLTRLLFHRGQYRDDALQLTASCLEWFTLGLLPGLVLSILHRAFPAFGRPWLATWTSVIWAASTVVATIVLMPRLGARALPAGFTIGITVGCLTSCILLSDLVGWQFFVIVGRSLRQLALLSVLPAVLAWGVVNWVASLLALATISDFVAPLIVVTVGTSVFCLCYAALCVLSRHPQMTRLVDLVRNRLRPMPLGHVIRE
jgi:peptidoglycan biosynthesis protein MviN/MurJ (putative lipid II flippase)